VELGFVVGMRLEHLGTGTDRWARAGEWALVIVGSLVVGFVVLAFVVFLAIFGSLLGLYIAAAASATYLAVRVASVARQRRSSRRNRPA
jgi:hypothetical protein